MPVEFFACTGIHCLFSLEWFESGCRFYLVGNRLLGWVKAQVASSYDKWSKMLHTLIHACKTLRTVESNYNCISFQGVPAERPSICSVWRVWACVRMWTHLTQASWAFTHLPLSLIKHFRATVTADHVKISVQMSNTCSIQLFCHYCIHGWMIDSMTGGCYLIDWYIFL